MKPKFIVIVLASLLLLISCRRSHDKSTDESVFNVSFDQCKDFIDIKLSDLIDDCMLVPLETTDESLLTQNPRICTVANYLIMMDRNGMYKFTHEGQFIKKLLNSGRGPYEIPPSYTFFANEKITR